MNSPSVCVAVKVFISLSLLKADSLDVGGYLAVAERTTWLWGCAMEWLLWVAVGLDLGGHWAEALGVPARARVVALGPPASWKDTALLPTNSSSRLVLVEGGPTPVQLWNRACSPAPSQAPGVKRHGGWGNQVSVKTGICLMGGVD